MNWDQINSHRDAGTCYLCGKPILDGEPIHGLTGSHWDCYEIDQKKIDAALEKGDAALKRAHEILKGLK